MLAATVHLQDDCVPEVVKKIAASLLRVEHVEAICVDKRRNGAAFMDFCDSIVPLLAHVAIIQLELDDRKLIFRRRRGAETTANLRILSKGAYLKQRIRCGTLVGEAEVSAVDEWQMEYLQPVTAAVHWHYNMGTKYPQIFVTCWVRADGETVWQQVPSSKYIPRVESLRNRALKEGRESYQRLAAAGPSLPYPEKSYD